MSALDKRKKAGARRVRLPAEWEPQTCVWLAWPHRREDWPGKFAPIPWVFVEIIRAIAAHQSVSLVVGDRRQKRDASRRLEAAHVDLDRVEFFRARTDRGWMRDCGPQFVEFAETGGGPSAAVLDWKFNAWAKYPEFRFDNRIPKIVANRHGLEHLVPRAEVGGRRRRIVLEGGAIDTDGQGTLLTTEECLLSTEIQARNPGIDRAGYEAIFRDWMGIDCVIWLGRGIRGDDTHGHVDDISRFVAPGRVLTCRAGGSDSNGEALEENRERLLRASDARGRPIEVVDLPLPRTLWFRGEPLPASYANFLITNRVVLVPTFNDPNDRVAIGIIQDCFPDREIVGIHSVDLIWGLGAVHCLSKEQFDPSPRDPS
jgi:agmatine deiminase